METKEVILKVSGGTNAKSLATSIAENLKKDVPCTVRLKAVGAAAISQAIKATAIARGYLAPTSSYSLAVVPYFDTTEINGEERTVMVMECIDYGR